MNGIFLFQKSNNFLLKAFMQCLDTRSDMSINSSLFFIRSMALDIIFEALIRLAVLCFHSIGASRILKLLHAMIRCQVQVVEKLSRYHSSESLRRLPDICIRIFLCIRIFYVKRVSFDVFFGSVIPVVVIVLQADRQAGKAVQQT